MRYQFDLVIPAGTLKQDPTELRAVMDFGIIRQALVRFRAGPHNRVYVSVYQGLHQVIPASQDEALYEDDYIFAIPMELKLNDAPYELLIKGWTTGTNYSHTITFWFDLEPIEPAQAGSLLESLLHLGGVPRSRR